MKLKQIVEKLESYRDIVVNPEEYTTKELLHKLKNINKKV